MKIVLGKMEVKELEQRFVQLTKEVDSSLKESRHATEERFKEIHDILDAQASSNSRIEKRLDALLDRVIKDEEEVTPEIEEESEEREEVYKTPPTERRNTSYLVAAYKHVGLVVRPPPAEGATGVESWLTESMNSLAKAYPTLPSSQLIEVVSSRLPPHINAAIRTSNIDDREKFVSHVTSIYSHRERGEETSKMSFYGYVPNDRSLLEVATDLQSLSKNVTWDENDRMKALNAKFLSIIPYPQKIEVERLSGMLGSSASLLDLVSRIYQFPEMRKEIEKHFTVPIAKRVRQIKPSSTGNNVGPNKRKGMESKRIRCRRCGSYKHEDDSCPMYGHTAEEPCGECLNLTGFKHYHTAGECVMLAANSAKSKN